MSYGGTSPLHYRQKLDASSETLNRPLDALAARGILNNGLHLADESAQVIVAWSAASGGNALHSDSSTSPGMHLIAAWPMHLRLRETGVSYYIRVRLAGASSDGVATSRLWAAIAPLGTGGGGVGGAGFVFGTGDHVFRTATTTSSTPAWLTGTSQGPNAWTSLIRLDAARASIWSSSRYTLTDVSGTPASVQVVECALAVFGETTGFAGQASNALLYGVYAAEYVGA